MNDLACVFSHAAFAAYAFTFHGNEITFMKSEFLVHENTMAAPISFFEHKTFRGENLGDDSRVTEVAEMLYDLWPQPRHLVLAGCKEGEHRHKGHKRFKYYESLFRHNGANYTIIQMA